MPGKNGVRSRVKASSLLNTASRQGAMHTGPAGGDGTGCTPHRRGCRFRRAGSVQRRTGPRSARTGAACCGGRTPGSPGPVLLPGAVVRHAGHPAPPRRPGRHAAGAGQLIYVGSNRRHPGQVGHHVRPLGVVAHRAQIDRRREPLGVQVGQPPGAPAQPADLIEQAVADQVALVQLGVVIPVGVFWGRPARRPQSSQRSIQLVHVRRGSDLVYPRW